METQVCQSCVVACFSTISLTILLIVGTLTPMRAGLCMAVSRAYHHQILYNLFFVLYVFGVGVK